MRWLICLSACSFGTLSFTCTTDAQCGASARCLDGACALPASDCPGGLRYDASSGRSGCVELPDLAVAVSFDLAAAVPAPIGAACSANKDCESGSCTDGNCCDAPCSALCFTCAGGHCRPAASGTNPRGDCAADGTPCGLDGSCDGAGACRQRAAGTVCTPQSCSGGILTRAGTCDGNGACSTPTMRSCAPYPCLSDGSDCALSCGADAGACEPPNSCSAGKCGLASAGAHCDGPADCLSNHCADGVCCGSDCAGTCVACNLAGQEGTCAPLPAGSADPACADQGAATCGRSGKCDGAGGCAYYPAGTVCAEAHCSPDQRTFIDTSTCPGSGAACTSAGTYGCDPYVCVQKTQFSTAHCQNQCGCCLCLPGMNPPFPENCAVGRSCVNRCSDLMKWACQ